MDEHNESLRDHNDHKRETKLLLALPLIRSNDSGAYESTTCVRWSDEIFSCTALRLKIFHNEIISINWIKILTRVILIGWWNIENSIFSRRAIKKVSNSIGKYHGVTHPVTD